MREEAKDTKKERHLSNSSEGEKGRKAGSILAVERRLPAAALALTVALAPSNTERQTEGSRVPSLLPSTRCSPPPSTHRSASGLPKRALSLSLSVLCYYCANFTSLLRLSRSLSHTRPPARHVLSPSHSLSLSLAVTEQPRVSHFLSMLATRVLDLRAFLRTYVHLSVNFSRLLPRYPDADDCGIRTVVLVYRAREVINARPDWSSRDVAANRNDAHLPT